VATTVEVVEFTRTDPAPIVRVLDAMTAAAEPGWVNLGPAIDDDARSAVRERSGLAAWFSARGPAVPMATWVPRGSSGRAKPAEVGLSHGTGPDALGRLAAHGLELPAGWQRRQDHAKRGIVAELPAAVDHRAVVDWLVGAMTVLSEVVPVGERWVAEVHRPA
jgi:hypothetical protein